MNLNAMSVSRDYKWIVCGAQRGASVWDAETQVKVVEVEGRRILAATDIVPESSRFATGTGVWSITTSERLFGPLEHDNDVRGVMFSPDDKLLATACKHGKVRVLDGYSGDLVITINTIVPSFYPITPLTWSSNKKDRDIFATSVDNRVKSFGVAASLDL